MKYRPILFSGPMVRALLDGRKTQTRRVVKTKSHHQIEERDDGSLWPWMYDGERDADAWMSCPYGQPGDRLWVRETWAQPDRRSAGFGPYIYAADWQERPKHHWNPSIHMPRLASRITLEVTGVRVERLQDITPCDAVAEGLQRLPASGRYVVTNGDQYMGFASTSPVEIYRDLWESINGPGSWNENPWVWVIEFKRVEGGAA